MCYVNMELPIYEAIFEEGVNEGVYAISLVEDPAMQDEWIALKTQEKLIQFTAIEDKKNMLLGAALIPNKKVYRNIDGNEFYLMFTEQTISKLAHNFLKEGNQNNSSAEHEIALNDVSFVESWQVQDPEIDKSALYGKSFEKGTWVVMAKVSDDIYKQATDGTFKGFSIDAMLGLEKINLNNTQMKKEEAKSLKDDILDSIKTLLSTFNKEKKEEVKVEAAEDIIVENDDKVELEEVFDKQSFKSELMANFEEMLNDMMGEKDQELAEKDEEIAELKSQLSKQPEKEEIVVAPKNTELKQAYKYGSKKPLSIHDRVLTAIND